MTPTQQPAPPNPNAQIRLVGIYAIVSLAGLLAMPFIMDMGLYIFLMVAINLIFGGTASLRGYHRLAACFFGIAAATLIIALILTLPH